MVNMFLAVTQVIDLLQATAAYGMHAGHGIHSGFKWYAEDLKILTVMVKVLRHSLHQ